MEDIEDDLMEAIMMIRRIRMRLEVALKTNRETFPIISMIRMTKIREEKDLE